MRGLPVREHGVTPRRLKKDIIGHQFVGPDCVRFGRTNWVNLKKFGFTYIPTEMPADALVRIWPANENPELLIQWPPRLMMEPTGLSVLDTRFRDEEAREWTSSEIEN